jgi:GTP-binding protein YchF
MSDPGRWPVPPGDVVERFGFVGLPNAGKSSLYNALAGGGALAAPYAFATTDPNIGVARVPDGRLGQLAEMSDSQKVVPATVQFADIGGLVEGAAQGEGLGNKFLAGIREVDAIVFVLRAFRDGDVPGDSDPVANLGIVEVELALADLDTAERQLDKLQRASKGDPSVKPTVAVLADAVDLLGSGVPLYRGNLQDDARGELEQFFLLTNKPVLAIVNLDEEQVAEPDQVLAPVQALLEGADVIGMCVQLEAEAALLDEDDRVEMLDGLGLGEGALPRFVQAAYHQLGLRTFFTTGEKESRAWTFRAGSSAPECAGRIHTDFQRGFIRAETIRWDTLLGQGSWTVAREAGLVRSEGKDYHPVDGDVMEFRFNV